jgi:hypothetical protein
MFSSVPLDLSSTFPLSEPHSFHKIHSFDGPIDNDDDLLFTRIDTAEDPIFTVQAPSVAPGSGCPRRREALLCSAYLSGKTTDCDDPDLLSEVTRSLQHHLEAATARGDFKEVSNSNRAIEAAQAQMKDLLKKRVQQGALENVTAKMGEARIRYARFCEAMDAKERKLEQDLQEQVQRMKERQRHECEAHDRAWQGGRKKRMFNRTSQKLRELRNEQKLLLAARRFEEAAQVSAIADRQLQEETIESHHQMLASFAESKALLEKRHSDEMKTLQTASEARRAEFRGLREKLAIKHENRFATLAVPEEDVANQDHVWNRKNRGGEVRGPVTPKKIGSLPRLLGMASAKTVRQSTVTVRE